MALKALRTKVSKEIGVEALWSTPRDAKILCAQRFVRLCAYSGTTLILALFLEDLGLSNGQTGLFMTLTLVGDVVVGLFLTIWSDAIGRRLTLALGSLLMIAGGVVFATSDVYWHLLLASIFGVISPSANEIDPFKAVEESTLSNLASLQDRSTVFAWYILFGTAGQAFGTIYAGWIAQRLQEQTGWTPVDAYRIIFWAYAAFGVLKLLLCVFMSSGCERSKPKMLVKVDARDPVDCRPLLEDSQAPAYGSFKDVDRTSPPASVTDSKLTSRISRDSWLVVGQLCFLFALDSIASGLAPTSWMTYYFNRKFGTGEGTLGSILFGSSIISSALNLVSSSMSKRIGLAKTMVLCHLPASITLAIISVPSNVFVAMGLFIFRMSTKDMDTAPRQSFVAAVVADDERTAVMGLINIVRTIMISVGPSVTGALAGSGRFWIAFAVAGCLKIAYNVIIAVLFWNFETKEEKLQKPDQEEE